MSDIQSEALETLCGLQERLTAFPRMHGKYMLDLTSIAEWRRADMGEEEMLDRLFNLWGEHETLSVYLEKMPPIASQGQVAAGWVECAVNPSDAREFLRQSLIGGGSVGHTVETVPAHIAEEMVTDFFGLFEQPTAYSGLGWSDPKYVFENGVVILDEKMAGMFLVIESD
ncbi:hypothetical protein [Deinococcus depolymerans]|uniref:Uncharacterized protein n=1 Tax=Deinococcus depolymerans TaxID=392408 RepID=A0ABN1C2Y6_9DEIO